MFNALSEQLDGRLRVFFLTERARRAWPVYRDEIRFDYEVLPGVSVRPFGPQTQLVYANLPILTRLRRRRVEAMVVGGYNHLEVVWTLAHGRRAGYPVLLWSESVAAARGRRQVRTAIKRRLVEAFDGYVVPGRRAAEQLRFLGADPDRVFLAPNAVDVGFWSQGARPRPADRRTPRLLFVGRLDRWKGLDLLIEVLRDERLGGLDVDVVGEGPGRATVEAAVRDFGLRARLFGHLERHALRERYHEADVLVFPTRADHWGLVLNEAMACGCVPLASSAAGAATDLVVDGKTGLVVPTGDAEALKDGLLRLCADPALRARLSAAALEESRRHTPDRCAAGFVHALEATR
jgi:glycosyltransferase involved in cell wall biosynthesis